MTRPLILASLAALAMCGAAAAQTADRSSAAPTARSGPDGGKAYEYPPSTGAILPPSRRTPYDRAPDRDEGATGGTATPRGLSAKPPEQVGR